MFAEMWQDQGRAQGVTVEVQNILRSCPGLGLTRWLGLGFGTWVLGWVWHVGSRLSLARGLWLGWARVHGLRV